MPETAASPFEQSFQRAKRRIQLLRGLRSGLTGLASGSVAIALASAGAWALGHPVLDPWLISALGGAGLLGGVFLARRDRWRDVDVALFLDARLSSQETLTSAVESQGEDTASAEALRARATAVLSAANPRSTRPRVLVPSHALILSGAAALAVLAHLPAPRAAPTPKVPAGTQLLKKGNVAGLERIEALDRAESLSPTDAEQLRKLAEDARKLRADLARGLPHREAQARIGQLRQEIASERQRFNEASERSGLEAAVNTLSSEASTRRAAKALEEGDVVAFDEEMQRLANQAETQARERAREALERAQKDASAKNGKKLAEFLQRQQQLFAEREDAARALRELGKALAPHLSPEARSALEQFERQGDPEAAQRLAEALGDALSELSEDERKRLLEELAKRLEGAQGGEPMDPKQLAELAKRLSTAEGRDALRDALRELASPQSADAARERALEGAERGGAEAEKGLTPVPMPGVQVPGPGGTGPPSPPNGSDPGGNGDRSGGGPGKHERKEPLPPPNGALELRAKADAQLLPGAPLGTRSLGRAPARPGETANRLGTGQLGTVAADEISAVENSDVPEEYREQVGRYFQP